MPTQPHPDTVAFFRWLMAGGPPGALYEVRLLPRLPDGRKGGARIGYFDDPIRAALAVAWWGTGKAQCYVGLNPRRSDIGTEEQRSNVVKCPDGGKAEDVTHVQHVLIDFDPARAEGYKGEPSTPEELELAHQRARQADAWLQEQGFSMPMACMSGNGYHLLCKLPLLNPAEVGGRVASLLHEIADQFSDALVEVDVRVGDAPRITKIPGTISVKGTNTLADRPWRLARLLRPVPPTPDEKLAEHILSLSPIIDAPQGADGEQARETIRLGESERRHPEHEMAYALQRCAFLRHAEADAVRLPEPEWFALVTNLLTFENGEAKIHELSKPYPKYSVEETDVKIAHALRSSPGPHRCDHIASVGWRCPYIDICPANAPASLAIRDAPRSTDALDMADETKVATLDGVPEEIREILATTPPADDTARAQLVARVAHSLVGGSGWSMWMALDAIGYSQHGADRPRSVIRMWMVSGLEDEAKAVQVPSEPDVAGAEMLLSDLPGAYIGRLLEGDEAERVGVLIDLAQAGAPEATVLGASLLGDGGADDYRKAVAILNTNGGVSR